MKRLLPPIYYWFQEWIKTQPKPNYKPNEGAQKKFWEETKDKD